MTHLQQIRSQALNAGFSRANTAGGQFILFDEDTDGRCGRCVYIDEAVISKFQAAPSSAVADFRYMFHRIKQLKARAGDLTSHFDPANPASKVSMIGKAEVTYLIRQHTDSDGLPAGVYISDIDLARFSGAEPGLYHIDEDRGRFVFNERRRTRIATTRAAINGLCEGAEQAATRILPPMVNGAYSDRKWDKAARAYVLTTAIPYSTTHRRCTAGVRS